MLTVLTMLTMIYLFENTSSDRARGIYYSSIEESFHRCWALLGPVEKARAARNLFGIT